MSKRTILVRALTLATALAGGSGQPASAAGTVETAPTATQSASLRPISTTTDALAFDNGDLLYGTLLSIDSHRVGWQRPDATQPLAFQLEHVTAVFLRERAVSNRVDEPRCRIRLFNEDELEGRLVSMDADKVALDTWYSGPLSIPRAAVQALLPVAAKGRTLFTGPTGLEGWTIGQVKAIGEKGGVWRYKNGAFYAAEAASIARDVRLPDVAKLQFDIAWKGMLYLAIALYTEYMQPVSLANKESEPPFGGFYSLQINSYTATLLPVTQKEPLRQLGQVLVPNFSRSTRSHIEIRVDKSKRLVALFVDGAMIKQWIDPEQFVGTGTGIRLVHQGQGTVRLNHLEVSEWDGQFEEPLTLSPAGPLDQIKLRNGDRIVGNLQSVRDDKLTVLTAGTVKEIPLSQAKQVELAAPKPGPPTRATGNARVFFLNGASVTLDLERWDERGVRANNTVLGRVQFDATAFARIVFLSHTAQ